ncbi:MAG: glycosyltransferase family 1 protein [Bacteroidota bacterium]
MKICIDARNIRANPSGLCRYALHIVRGMAELDKTNTYYILRDKRFQKRIVDNDNFIDIYDPLKDTGSVQNALFGAFVVNKYQLDVFHTLNQVVPFGLKAKRILTTVHDLMWFEAPTLSFESKAKARGANLLARTSFASSYRRANKVICISKTTEKIFQNWFPKQAHKTAVVSHHDVFFLDDNTRDHFDMEELNQELPERFIFSIGNSKPYKNVDGVFKAFSRIAAAYPKVKIVVVGRMDRKAVLQELAQQLGIAQQVHFVSQQVSDHDLKLLFKRAQFLAFPSFYEGYGIPLLEALSMGCPVLGSTVDIVKETTGGVATYVDPHDLEEMATRMRRLLEEPRFQAELRQQGLDYIDSLRSYNSVERTHRLYFE